MTPKVDFIAHMEAIAADADSHDQECGDAINGYCASNRHFSIAALMNCLDLDLSDLGYIAEAWLDLQCEGTAHEATDSGDEILNAKEIGE